VPSRARAGFTPGFLDRLSVGFDASPAARISFARVLFAASMFGLGVLGLIYGDFALTWQRIPIEHLPERVYFAYASAAIELLAGLGLLLRSSAMIASRVLLIFLLLWLLLLRLPAVVLVPWIEGTWLGFGEIAVIVAGGWIVFAEESARSGRGYPAFAVGADGVGWARLLFIVSLPMIGLSHFIYAHETAAFVPSWLPFPLGWAWLTGAGSFAACVGLLFGVWPRLAATLEAAMLSVITLLVWGAGVVKAPQDRTQWTGLMISAAIASGAWLVADSCRRSAGWRSAACGLVRAVKRLRVGSRTDGIVVDALSVQVIDALLAHTSACAHADEVHAAALTPPAACEKRIAFHPRPTS